MSGVQGAKVFIDSNVFLYSIDQEQVSKRNLAQRWLQALVRSEAGITNLQVLNEVTNVFLKRMKQWPPERVFEIVDGFAELGSEPLSHDEVTLARNLRLRYRYSWWDCLLLASALELGCKFFLSEDLQDGQIMEGLTIVDPFAHSPDQILSLR